jgi:anti-sigma factor RsiW
VELVTNYLEGALPSRERLLFEAHLGACPLCARYMAQFRQTIAATGQLRDQDLAPEAKEALLGAFRNWKTS